MGQGFLKGQTGGGKTIYSMGDGKAALTLSNTTYVVTFPTGIKWGDIETLSIVAYNPVMGTYNLYKDVSGNGYIITADNMTPASISPGATDTTVVFSVAKYLRFYQIVLK